MRSHYTEKSVREDNAAKVAGLQIQQLARREMHSLFWLSRLYVGELPVAVLTSFGKKHIRLRREMQPSAASRLPSLSVKRVRG